MIFRTEAAARRELGARPDLSGVVVVRTTHGHWAITGAERVKLEPKICSICGEPFPEYPNRAWPVNDGECCAYCDEHAVTPARIRMMRETV
jgi:hypothetical protein